MVNKNYRRGILVEYKLKKELESKGFFVVRAASSKGAADLVCVTPTDIRLIQLKRSKKALSPNFINSMYEDDITKLQGIEVPDNCYKFLYVWIDNHGWHIFKILKDRIEKV